MYFNFINSAIAKHSYALVREVTQVCTMRSSSVLLYERSERDKKWTTSTRTTNGKSKSVLLKNMWRTIRCGTTPPLSLVIPRKQAKETSVRLKPVSTINLRTCRLPTLAN